jgi:hypothetical protein
LYFHPPQKCREEKIGKIERERSERKILFSRYLKTIFFLSLNKGKSNKLLFGLESFLGNLWGCSKAQLGRGPFDPLRKRSGRVNEGTANLGKTILCADSFSCGEIFISLEFSLFLHRNEGGVGGKKKT